jgi:hypothetical protein
MPCVQTKSFRCHLTEVAYNEANGANYLRSAVINSLN